MHIILCFGVMFLDFDVDVDELDKLLDGLYLMLF